MPRSYSARPRDPMSSHVHCLYPRQMTSSVQVEMNARGRTLLSVLRHSHHPLHSLSLSLSLGHNQRNESSTIHPRASQSRGRGHPANEGKQAKPRTQRPPQTQRKERPPKDPPSSTPINDRRATRDKPAMPPPRSETTTSASSWGGAGRSVPIDSKTKREEELSERCGTTEEGHREELVVLRHVEGPLQPTPTQVSPESKKRKEEGGLTQLRFLQLEARGGRRLERGRYKVSVCPTGTRFLRMNAGQPFSLSLSLSSPPFVAPGCPSGQSARVPRQTWDRQTTSRHPAAREERAGERLSPMHVRACKTHA